MLKSHETNESRYGFKFLDGVADFKNGMGQVLLINPYPVEISLPKNLTIAQEEIDEGITYDFKPQFNLEEAKINPELLKHQRHRVREMLKKYKKVFYEEATLEQKLQRPIKHVIEIEPGSKPVNLKPYRVPVALEPTVEAEIQKLIDKNYIRPTKSEYSSPIHLIKKKDGSFRFICDFRALNQITKKFNAPIGQINDLLTKLRNAKFYSTLDLQSGFFQVAMDENSRKYTAIATHVGNFEWNVCPMGLSNSPRTFVGLINSIFHQIKNVLVYLDDIIVFSENFEEHLNKLETVFKLLLGNHLICNLKKCNFAFRKVKFLGHIVSYDGIEPDLEKTRAVRNFSTPKDKRALRSFLGLANYYRRFIKNFSQIAAKLYLLIGEKVEFKWTAEHQEAFETLKKLLTEAPVIKQFDVNLPTFLTTDASLDGLGAVLEQESDGVGHVIEYASRSLRL